MYPPRGRHAASARGCARAARALDGARGRVPRASASGRCCGSWAHWRSVRPTRAAVRALLPSVPLCGCRSGIWDRQCGRPGGGSVDIGCGPRVIIRPCCPAAPSTSLPILPTRCPYCMGTKRRLWSDASGDQLRCCGPEWVRSTRIGPGRRLVMAPAASGDYEAQGETLFFAAHTTHTN